MDQPPQQSPPISVEGILAWFLGVIATLGAIVVRGKFRVKAMREKVEAEAAPSIQKENIAWTKDLIEDRTIEVDKLREQLEKEREHRYKHMEQIADMRVEIAALRAEVIELKRQIASAGGAVKREES